MRKDSYQEHYEIFLITSCIAAHVSYVQAGFRQKDIKFLVDMFSNWVDVTLKEQALLIHNTQIMRYLDSLVEEGYARKMMKGGQPRYRLTRVGLLSLLSTLGNRPPQFPLEYFYFVHHIMDTYRGPIERIIKAEGTQFPPAMKIELDSIFDSKKLIDTHLQFVNLALAKLKQRILDSQSVSKLVVQYKNEKKPTENLVAEIERLFPYDLNSQKPLTEFYNEIPSAIRDWILETALPKRAQQLWVPLTSVLEGHLKILQEMHTLHKKRA